MSVIGVEERDAVAMAAFMSYVMPACTAYASIMGRYFPAAFQAARKARSEMVRGVREESAPPAAI